MNRRGFLGRMFAACAAIALPPGMLMPAGCAPAPALPTPQILDQIMTATVLDEYGKVLCELAETPHGDLTGDVTRTGTACWLCVPPVGEWPGGTVPIGLTGDGSEMVFNTRYLCAGAFVNITSLEVVR